MSGNNLTPESPCVDHPQVAIDVSRPCDSQGEEIRGPSSIVLPKTSGAPLQIGVVDGQCRAVKFKLDKDLCDQAGFKHGDAMVLAFDPDTPMFIGLTADAGHTVGRRTPRLQRGGNNGATWTVTLGCDQVQAFFPQDLRSSYQHSWNYPHRDVPPRVGAQSVWFHLPHGRSVHLLKRYFGPFEDLEDLLEGWLDRVPRPSGCYTRGIRATPQGSFEYFAHFWNMNKPYIEIVIPSELLDDPIRNGSPFPPHGFNPWNEIQRLKITDFLDTQVRQRLEET